MIDRALFFNEGRRADQVEAAVESMIDRVSKSIGDFGQFEEDIIGVLGSENFKRSGNYETDLKNAYKQARRNDAKLSKEQKMDKTMRRAFDKAQRRGA